jgi:DNA polymerase I-like protein with 3'-5' exonuclease and polymerase domains
MGSNGPNADHYASAGRLQTLLEDPEVPVISMTKYDARYLRLQGWTVTGPFYDIQVMAWVMNENQSLSLDSISKRYCGRTMDKRLSRSDGEVYFRCDDGRKVNLKVIATIDPEAWEQFSAYCLRDVEAEAEDFQTLWERLEDTTWLDYYLEECVPFTETLLDMECAGLPVNLEASEKLRIRLESEVVELRGQLLAQGSIPSSFNLNSGDQLAAYLYYPVCELVDSLDLGEWATGAVKSCLEGEHEDCEVPPYVMGDEDDTELRLHMVDCLPKGFTLDKLGRTQAHGRWTFKGRSLPATDKTKSGDKWSVSSPTLKSNLAAMQDPWVLKLSEYRRYMKALTTYLRKYPVLAWPRMQEGAGETVPGSADSDTPVSPRLYGRFNQTGTKTGRLSSSEPNLQNQPSHGPLGKEMRSLFQGRLIVGDYSQLEPRLMAHFSEDPFLLDVYRTGKDIYREVAARIFGVSPEDVSDDQRGIAKTLVLAMGYGAGDKKVAQILTINGYPTDVVTAGAYLKYLHDIVDRFFAWREHVIRDVKARGYVKTLSGRHRRLKAAFLDRKNWKNVGYGERQAVNAVVQGSAGDIVAHTMQVWPAYMNDLRDELTLLAQVHDELVWEHTEALSDPQDRNYVLETLKNAAEQGHGYKLRVPLVFEPHFGDSWYSAKEGASPLELPEDLEDTPTLDFEEDA